MNVLINVRYYITHLPHDFNLTKNNAVILYAAFETVKTEYENTKASNKREK